MTERERLLLLNLVEHVTFRDNTPMADFIKRLADDVKHDAEMKRIADSLTEE